LRRGFGFLIGRDMAGLFGLERHFNRCWIVGLPRSAVSQAGVRFKRVAGFHPGFGVGAFRACVAAMLETLGPGRDGSRYHPHMAVRAARTVDRQ
jgi:carbohydrate-binding DOMON domain-containing protein